MALQPSELARETFKTLTQRRLPPTPENYWHIYREVAGEVDSVPEQGLVNALLRLAGELRPALRRDIEDCVSERNWPRFGELLLKHYEQLALKSAWTMPWPELIRELIRQWESRQPALTTARKQEMLARVLINFGHDAAVLNEKLAALVRAWSDYSIASNDVANDFGPEAPAQPVATASPEWEDVKELLAQTLELGLAPRLIGWPDLQEEAVAIARHVRASQLPLETPLLQAQLRKYWLKLEIQAEQEGRLLTGITGVLRFVVDNLAEVSSEDAWLVGQYAVVQNLLSGPLDMQVVYRAELSLKGLAIKQGTLKHSLDEAKIQLKQLISTFIDRLGSLSDSTGSFHDKMIGYAHKIKSAEHIGELSNLVGTLMDDTRAMQLDVMRSRDELSQARLQAEAAQRRIEELEAELQAVSEKVKEDELTGALNRRGLEEAVARETARADRYNDPLCLALLDIDNFKRLNDRLGHKAGDEALQHLVEVVQDTLRPTDVVARYGGEEFAILLPHTQLDEAIAVLERLQRELTRRYFLHNNERLLITFSAGVTVFRPEDTEDSAMARADLAMYRAKKAGKNRVEQI